MKKDDIVKVVKPGYIYPSYESMAKQFGADISSGKWEKYRYGSGKVDNLIAKVLGVEEIKRYGVKIHDPVCIIKQEICLIEIMNGDYVGNQYVINSSGLKWIRFNNILEDELFEI